MRSYTTRSFFFAVAGCLAAAAALAQAGSTNVPNWTVPPYRASSASGGLQTMADISQAAIFVAITTCRVFDTRGPVGPYGGPRLVANVTRNFDVDSGPCAGIPPGSAAFSMNFGAILPDGANSFITIWPTLAAMPTSSFMNPIQGTVVSNAAIIPANSTGSISVFPNTGVHLYGDINGYFMDAGGALNDDHTLFVDGSDSDFGMITGVNRDTTSTSTTMSGVHGWIHTTMGGPSAVLAQSFGESGANFALRAQNDSSSGDAAAVFAQINADDDPVNPAAVFAKSAVRGQGGASSFGVLGISENVGVAGYIVSGAGAILASGRLGSASGVDPGGGAPPWAVFANGDIGATGAKFFLEPHPSDAAKVIAYVALEGPEAGTYFRGRGKFERGMARIPVPEDFRMVTDPEGITVQITPIGAMASFAVMKVDLDEIVVQSSRNVEFYYLVHGVRSTLKDLKPIRNESVFAPESEDATMPAWLSAGQKRLLVQNGTYRADGSINMETARRLGWDRIWSERNPRPEPRPAE